MRSFVLFYILICVAQVVLLYNDKLVTLISAPFVSNLLEMLFLMLPVSLCFLGLVHSLL